MNSKLLYSGKAKNIMYKDSDKVIVYFKDSTTAFNGVKKANIKNKGIINCKISELVFDYLIKKGVKTHYIEGIDNRSQLCKKVDIFPIEFICRNVVTGSLSKRLGIVEGETLKDEIVEICYKNDSLDDPLINDHHALALGIINEEQLEHCYKQLSIINNMLITLFDKVDITLVDFKVEFGIDGDGEIILADEFSPDNCRLWDKNTNKKLDKDVFRKDLGDIIETYQVILNRLEVLDY